MRLELVNSKGNHAGLSVILAKDSAIKHQNVRIRRMISEIIPPATKTREIAKETAVEISEAVAAEVDKECLDRAIEAEPQMMIKTLRALMRSMAVERLIMRNPADQTDIQKRGHSSMRMHTDPRAARMAGSLIAGRQACPPEISPYLSTWIRVKVTSLLRVGSVCL